MNDNVLYHSCKHAGKPEKRAGILLSAKADVETTVDGIEWKLLASAKIETALEARGPCLV